jgi:transcriptional regulator with XRE-family HTH domain
MTKIGTNIKKIRQTKGLSQQAFADIFGITRGNISSYEENRAEPKIETVIKIANNFSIPLESLLLKDLSINEILQYNADKILEDEMKLSQYKLKEIPLVSDDVLAKIWSGDMDFNAIDEFPKICLPDMYYGKMIALLFNTNIPHHEKFESFKTVDILVFKNFNEDNQHLAKGRLGMYINESKIKLGEFMDSDTKLVLSVHADNALEITKDNLRCFWILNGYYNANMYN